MKVSIIIPTYNRCLSLGFLLDKLKNLHLSDGVKCEVLVIDNNSTDFTKEVTTKYFSSEQPTFRYIVERNRGKSYALNTGVKEAEGDIVVFTDDDCVPDPYWITSIVKEFRDDPSLSVLGGRVEPYDQDDIVESVSQSKERIHISHPKKIFRPPVIMGGNMAFRKKVFDVLSEFDTLLGPGTKTHASEDIDILYRLHKKGFKMVYAPEVLVFHRHGRKTQAEDNALMRAYGIGRGAVYCKNILQLDINILKIACEEVYSLSKTVLKGFILRKTFLYHQIALPSIFLGALYYYEARSSKRKILKRNDL